MWESNTWESNSWISTAWAGLATTVGQLKTRLSNFITSVVHEVFIN